MENKLRQHWLVLILYAYALPLSAFTDFYNGENILKPVARLEARGKYQTGVTRVNGNCVVATARFDQVIDLKQGWQCSLRVDAPYSWYFCPKCSQGRGCEQFDHFADLLVEAWAITPPADQWTFGAGMQLIFPTDGNNIEIGDAKYEVHPSVALAYDLSHWSKGAYAGFIVRYARSVGGSPVAPTINQTYIEPFFNINLPGRSFLNFSPEIRYNWATKRWFVPFDIMVGQMITDHLIASIEYENAIVHDYPKYAQQVEIRLGYLF